MLHMCIMNTFRLWQHLTSHIHDIESECIERARSCDCRHLRKLLTSFSSDLYVFEWSMQEIRLLNFCYFGMRSYKMNYKTCPVWQLFHLSILLYFYFAQCRCRIDDFSTKAFACAMRGLSVCLAEIRFAWHFHNNFSFSFRSNILLLLFCIIMCMSLLSDIGAMWSRENGLHKRSESKEAEELYLSLRFK